MRSRNPFALTLARDITGLNLLMVNFSVDAYLAGHTHAVYGVQDELSNVIYLSSAATQNGDYWSHTADNGVFASTPVHVGKWPRVVVLQPRQRYEGGGEFVSGRMVVRNGRVLAAAIETCGVSLG
jgi:hypothetical protein